MNKSKMYLMSGDTAANSFPSLLLDLRNESSKKKLQLKFQFFPESLLRNSFLKYKETVKPFLQDSSKHDIFFKQRITDTSS